MTKKNQNQYFSKTIEKGFKILSLFLSEKTRLSRIEISKLTGINMTSTYRFIDTLITLGYLRKDPRTKMLELGPSAFVMGHSFVNNFSIRSIVKPLLDQFYDKNKITVDSAVVYEETILLLYRRSSKQTVGYNIPTMATDLFHCSCLGKAVLAWLPPVERDSFLQRLKLKSLTQNTITSKKKLIEELELSRIRGYVINNEELMPGLLSIGAPLLNNIGNEPIGAISIDFSTAKHTVEQIQEDFVDILIQLANQISTSLY